MTGEMFAIELAALPAAERDRVVLSLLNGALEASMCHPNGVADLIGQALGSYGVAIVVLDRRGVRLHEGWDDTGPYGPTVTKIMTRVHDAINAIIDAELALERTVGPS